MPIRKPRRQTLQELAYPPVPKIGGVDLRADEKILGIEDWEIGDRSRRYPTTQALSLLSASNPSSRWGSSAGGSSVAGWPVASTVGSQASSGVSSPQKSSVTFPANPTTHQIKRKAPPSLDPTTASSTVSSNPSSSPSKLSSPSKADTSVSSTTSSPPKRSFDGVVRPGDIIPPNWSPLTPAPSSTASRERRVSQPAPPPTSYRSLAAPPSSTHTRSRSHSQTLILAQSLPTIAASPRPTVDEIAIETTKPLVPRSAPTSPTKPIQALSPTSPLRPVKNPALQPSSPSRPAGSQSTTSSSVSPSRVAPAPSTLAPPSTISAASSQPTSAPVSSFLRVPQAALYGFTPPPASTVSAPASALSSPNSGSQISASTQARSVSRTLPRPPGPSAALPAVASLALSAGRPTAASAPVSPVAGPQSAAITVWRSGVLASEPGLWGTSYGAQAQSRPPPPPPQPIVMYESTVPQARYQPASLPTRAQHQPSEPQTQTGHSPAAHALLPASHNSGMVSTQSAISPGGYAPNGGASQDDVPPAGPPAKLTRKLTKSRSPSSSAPRVVESNGSAFVSAQRALVGTHRPAQERIIWGLPLNRDPRVGEAVGKIEGIKERLIVFGAEQFVQSRIRGAIMCNVDYHPPGYPSELAFDWITLKDAQKTLEPVLQKAIIQSDPATSVLVIVFLLSSSLNSLAIWRKCVPIPPGLLDRRLLHEVERVKREIAPTERETVIKVWQFVTERIDCVEVSCVDEVSPVDSYPRHSFAVEVG
ncbi:hypothetical protein FRC10_009989 [Ceratobasidium sp. 414]|nr:hypothetical protein FRC10_009989 [Ceratobasidium sp. 414]